LASRAGAGLRIKSSGTQDQGGAKLKKKNLSPKKTSQKKKIKSEPTNARKDEPEIEQNNASVGVCCWQRYEQV